MLQLHPPQRCPRAVEARKLRPLRVGNAEPGQGRPVIGRTIAVGVEISQSRCCPEEVDYPPGGAGTHTPRASS